MKKVLAFTLVLTLGVIAVSAQNEKTENLNRHLTGQRWHDRQMRLHFQGVMNQRQQMKRNEIMQQRMMGNREMRLAEARRMGIMQMHQRHNMMLRRYYYHRRVI